MIKSLLTNYFKIVFNIFIIAISFGFILPVLISAPSTELVLLGFFYLFVILPFALVMINKTFLKSAAEVLFEKDKK